MFLSTWTTTILLNNKKKRHKKVDKKQIKPVFYLDNTKFLWCTQLPRYLFLKRKFFSIKNFKIFFFQSFRTFYLLNIFSWDRSIFIFWKKNYQISNLKKCFFFIFFQRIDSWKNMNFFKLFFEKTICERRFFFITDM